MKIKNLILTTLAIIASTLSLFTQAHEGHAPAGVVHDLHHMLWIVMALAVSAVAVFLIRNYAKKNGKNQN